MSRDVIGQAKGILMERLKITPEDAFDALRQASERLNEKLNAVALDLVETGELDRENYAGRTVAHRHEPRRTARHARSGRKRQRAISPSAAVPAQPACRARSNTAAATSCGRSSGSQWPASSSRKR